MLREPSPVPGSSSPYSPARLSVWQRSLGLMSRRWRGLPVGSYACRPHATLIHSMPWVSISRRMLWEPPCRASQTLFICLADRTHPSVGGVLSPIGGFMGPLCQIPPSVLWLAGADGRYADSMNYPTAGNSGPPGQGSNHAAPPSAGRAHPSQCGEPSLGLAWACPDRSPQNHEDYSGGRWGPLRGGKSTKIFYSSKSTITLLKFYLSTSKSTSLKIYSSKSKK